MKNKVLTIIAITSLATLSACSKAETAQPDAAVTTQVHEMKVTHVDAKQASELIAGRPDLVVLDVRTPGEFAQGHIEGAVNIDFKNADFATRLTELDLGQDYLIHCRSGGRSTRSLEVFKKVGFKHIIHMDGGIIGWNKAQLPTVK